MTADTTPTPRLTPERLAAIRGTVDSLSIIGVGGGWPWLYQRNIGDLLTEIDALRAELQDEEQRGTDYVRVAENTVRQVVAERNALRAQLAAAAGPHRIREHDYRMGVLYCLCGWCTLPKRSEEEALADWLAHLGEVS